MEMLIDLLRVLKTSDVGDYITNRFKEWKIHYKNCINSLLVCKTMKVISLSKWNTKANKVNVNVRSLPADAPIGQAGLKSFMHP